MFIGKYFDWNQKRLKGIIDFYGHQFMVNKTVLDLGCGYADISGPLHRLGAQVTALDARKEHLDVAIKKYPGIKIIKADLDREWIFSGQKFDIVLDLGILCHLRDYETHLRNVCSVANHLILETAVCDDNDAHKNVILAENKAIYDLSVNGKSSRPTAAAIERVLTECGFSFQRVTNNKFNSGSYLYDWKELNNSSCDFNKRRIWFCSKATTSVVPITSNTLTLSNTNIKINDSTPLVIRQESTMKKNMYSNNKVKFILDVFSPKYFFRKNILDAGSGDGELISNFLKLGAGVTAVDGRQQNLNTIQKKYPSIKTVKLNFESPLSMMSKFDIVFSIDTLCHIANYEQHLVSLCARAKDLILETSVCDSNDPNDSLKLSEDSSIHSLSLSGVGSRPSAARIEKILSEHGMSYIRVDDSSLNDGNYVYDWKVTDSKKESLSLRRFWVCSKQPQVITQVSSKLNNINNSKSIQSIAQLSNIPKPVSEVFDDSPKTSDISYLPKEGDKKFVIVIPSYKNEKWAEKNILSALNQNYSNFRIIYTDDCSPDSTFEKVSSIVASHKNKEKTTLIKNNIRKGALENLYNMIYSCEDEEIIITLDGDDWLYDNEVLSKLNSAYKGDVWMTYGQYQNYPDKARGIAKQIPDHVINSNNYRQYAWCSTHLRTFYTWLFKKINKEDLLYENVFAPSAWDMYIMFPMLEMSGHKAKYIKDILCVYNLENPINDHKVDQKLQQNLDRVCRSKKKYSLLSDAPKFLNSSKIGLLIIATGKYERYISQLIESADKLFFNSKNCEVKYFIFTDSAPSINSNRNYEIINIAHKEFPYASMDRFKHFTNNAEKFSKMDYLYYIDVDSKFVDHVSTEVLGNLVGVRHCGYYNGNGTFENNPKSVFYEDPKKYKYYFGGGFSGGKRESYLLLSKWCYEMIEKDLANSIMPRFHDETAINRYFLENEPDVILSPSYHYPPNNLSNYYEKWKPHKFERKILLLDKNHKEVRS